MLYNHVEMKIMEIFLFALGVIGMTHIIVDATIFQGFRDCVDKYLPASISKVFHCYQCLGFWSGLFCGWFAFTYHDNVTNIDHALTWGQLFLAGCSGSLLSNFMAIYLNYLEAKTIINLDKNDSGD